MPRRAAGLLSLLAAVLAAEDGLPGVPAAELVRLLADPSRAQRAHYELVRRADPDGDPGWTEFSRKHYRQRTVVCPQPDGEAPITLVLYGYHEPYLRRGDYLVDDPAGLFAEPAASEVPEPAIDAFAADGTRLDPFNGRNVLGGGEVLADLDADGWIERVDSANYGLHDGPTVTVVSIQRVHRQAEMLIALATDWGANDWTLAVDRPLAAGGRGSVRLGPRDATGAVVPRAVLRPDADGRWSLDPGWPQDHIAVLDGADIWASLHDLQERHPIFARDPSASAEEIRHHEAAPRPPPAVYAFRSLGADPRAVADFMRRGRSVRDLEREAELPDQLPAALWTLPPREAALAIAEANRSPAHRSRYLLAIDDRDGAEPPPTLCVDFAADSSRCYSDRRQVWRLRCDAEGAILAMAVREQGGVVLRDGVAGLPRLRIHAAAIDAQAARQAAEILWWLDRVRSLDRVPDHRLRASSCTADGRGLLLLADGAGHEAWTRTGTLWSGGVPQRWRGDYDHDALLNLARIVILDGLAPHTGFVVPDDGAGLRGAVEQVLERPGRFGNAIVLRAVEAAGDQAWPACDGALERIAASLPGDLPRLRTAQEIDADIASLQSRSEAHAELMQRYGELFSLDQRAAAAPQTLAAAIAAARERIRLAQDATALAELAAGDGPHADWALSRLSDSDRTAFVAALERRLARSDGATARAIFAAIASVDPERAAAIAEAQPAAAPDALTVAAASVLERTESPSDPAQRVAGLLAVLADRQHGWEQRSTAIGLLAPHDEPLRFPDPAIDAACIAILQPADGQADDGFVASTAALALARRGRPAALGRMVDLLTTMGDGWNRSRILAAAVTLAPQADAATCERLRTWIGSQLDSTSMCINDVLWAAWLLDDRRLLPAIEAIATAGPEDVEGPLATSYGGSPKRVAEHRYHLARRIAQHWREEDPAACTLLLLAMATGELGEWRDAVRLRLAAEAAGLAGHRAAVQAAAAWCRMRAADGDPALDAGLHDALGWLGVDAEAEAP